MGSRVIALLILDLGARRKVGSQHHAPAALPPGKDPVPTVQEALTNIILLRIFPL
jgi:hypothetical protein